MGAGAGFGELPPLRLLLTPPPYHGDLEPRSVALGMQRLPLSG